MKSTHDTQMAHRWQTYLYNRVLRFFHRLSTLDLSRFNLLKIVDKWGYRTGMRAKLVQYPDYLLEDMGLNREQVSKEYELPFWRQGIY